ncbi:hypothetical protein Barb7_03090 [Bacteroidales bacterium Barb7]|nr:hypothetical protein Barb7_03090 [Bacteroidales bacterium Barb7]
MEVSSQVNRGGEDALAVFAFAFAVELFPPFADVMQFRVEVGEDFYLPAVFV